VSLHIHLPLWHSGLFWQQYPLESKKANTIQKISPQMMEIVSTNLWKKNALKIVEALFIYKKIFIPR